MLASTLFAPAGQLVPAALLGVARMARFFEQAPAAICVLDGPDRVYELVNPAYQQRFPGQLLGRPAHEVWQGVGQQQVVAWRRQVYETGVAHEEHEVQPSRSRQPISTAFTRPATTSTAASMACWCLPSMSRRRCRRPSRPGARSILPALCPQSGRHCAAARARAPVRIPQ